MKSEVSEIANNKNLPLLDRIMCRVWQEDNSGCWIWLGASIKGKRKHEYRPRMRHQNNPHELVYRVLYCLLKNPIPDGMLACHKCDNGLCVNPAHIFIGTHRDNALDAASKGRYPQQKEPARFAEIARQLGKRNTWSKGSKRPNRKRPMKRAHLAALIALANLATIRNQS